MEKTTRAIPILLLLMALSISACSDNDTVDEATMPMITQPPRTQQHIGQGGDEMELLTKNEFIQYIQDNSAVLGVTMDDFQDIDIDDFITEKHFTEVVSRYFTDGRMNFKVYLENYISMLEPRRIYAYRTQELTEIDSTREEYERFRDKYFAAIGEEPRRLKEYSYFEHGFMTEGERELEFVIGQTMYIRQFAEENRNWHILENPLSLDFEWEAGSFDPYPLFISKCGKFFIGIWGRPYTERTVKTFCELE